MRGRCCDCLAIEVLLSSLCVCGFPQRKAGGKHAKSWGSGTKGRVAAFPLSCFFLFLTAAWCLCVRACAPYCAIGCTGRSSSEYGSSRLGRYGYLVWLCEERYDGYSCSVEAIVLDDRPSRAILERNENWKKRVMYFMMCRTLWCSCWKCYGFTCPVTISGLDF
jgi:hypothetical protein